MLHLRSIYVLPHSCLQLELELIRPTLHTPTNQPRGSGVNPRASIVLAQRSERVPELLEAHVCQQALAKAQNDLHVVVCRWASSLRRPSKRGKGLVL